MTHYNLQLIFNCYNINYYSQVGPSRSSIFFLPLSLLLKLLSFQATSQTFWFEWSKLFFNIQASLPWNYLLIFFREGNGRGTFKNIFLQCILVSQGNSCMEWGTKVFSISSSCFLSHRKVNIHQKVSFKEPIKLENCFTASTIRSCLSALRKG